MDIRHHGHLLRVKIERILRANPAEKLRGVKDVKVQSYWCPEAHCRKRMMIKQEIMIDGSISQWARIRAYEYSSFLQRQRLAIESDWVWGHDPVTFEKIKVTVR